MLISLPTPWTTILAHLPSRLRCGTLGVLEGGVEGIHSTAKAPRAMFSALSVAVCAPGHQVDGGAVCGQEHISGCRHA